MNSTDLLRSCPWMLEARRLIGAREIPGPAHSSAVVRMWESIKAPFRDDETPWCAAYVGSCLESAGIKSTRSAAARSYANYGEALVGSFSNAYGAIVVLNRPGKPWSGHVAFLTGYDSTAEVFQLLGGNQDNRVEFAEYPVARMVAVRWPPKFSLTPTPTLRCPPFKARGDFSRRDA